MINKAILEKAAKTLAEQFDYPWEHMPEQGRDNMRKIAGLVIADAVTEERERCAKVVESFGGPHRAGAFNDEIRDHANAIREGAAPGVQS